MYLPPPVAQHPNGHKPPPHPPSPPDAGFMSFVLTLKKNLYVYQFTQYAWTHMILMVGGGAGGLCVCVCGGGRECS